MLGDLTDWELSCLQDTRDACEAHSDDMCGLVEGSDPCEGLDEESLLGDL